MGFLNDLSNVSYRSYRRAYFNYRADNYLRRDAERLSRERQEIINKEFEKIPSFFNRAKELYLGLEMLLQNKNSYLTLEQVLDVFRVLDNEYVMLVNISVRKLGSNLEEG